MPANTQPIFPLTPKVSWGKLTTANTAMDGTGTVVELFIAGTNGSRIDQIKVRPLCDSATQSSNVATVLRLFINNGSTNATVANNSLAHETTIASEAHDADGALDDYVITVVVGSETRCPIPYLPAGYKILATVGTTISAGIQVTVHGGDY